MKKINPLKILLFVFLFIVGFSGGYFVTKSFPKKSSSTTTAETKPTTPKPADEVANPNIQVNGSEKTPGTITPISGNAINILFLGMGGAGHDGGGLTDSMTLANIDYGKKSMNLIALPRDLWYNNQKINAAYSTGGASALKFAIGQITGLNVNYYIAVDFGNFTLAIDTVGGIDIENPKTWDDYFYPIIGKEQDLCGFTPEYNAEINQKYKGFELEKLFTCRYEHLHFDKGPVHLDGTTALKYMRSRHSAEYGSDFARGERAQAILIAIGKKLIEQKLSNPNDTTFKKLAASMASDITLTKVPEILTTLGEVNSYPVVHTYLTDQNILSSATGPGGAYILIPKAGSGNFESVRAFIQNSK